MNDIRLKICTRMTFLVLAGLLSGACGGRQNKNAMENKELSSAKGSYGYDAEFLTKHKFTPIELSDDQSDAKVLILPQLQGRVMTSTAEGNSGKSFGWINYKLIESGKVSSQFNPYGGEERIWLGPEGGPFSVYFQQGKEQTFDNWVVPKELDTMPYDIVAQTAGSVQFRKDFSIVNASGTPLQVGLERSVKLLTRNDVEEVLALSLSDSLRMVAYESENVLNNKGNANWSREQGFLSIWLLSMFNPSEQGIVFIPVKGGAEADLGQAVTDDYFGKVPSDRLLQKNGMLFFKVDGKYRSKIGISPKRAQPFCGSYDPENKVLTLLWCSLPEEPALYVNSKWGEQSDPLKGDAINSYNDGPVADGSIMGPFYEIESSSPAAILKVGEKVTHRQRIFHISGSEAQLSRITEKLFNTSLKTIQEAFQ